MKFKKKWSRVGFGAFLLAVSSLLSRFLGVARDFVFSQVFGVGGEGGVFALDAYFAAFRIPDLMYTFLIAGAMSAAFIPIYTKLNSKADKDSDLFASQVLNGMLMLLLLSSVFAWIFAPIILPLIAPGFPVDVLTISIDLTRIMLLSPIFLGLSGVLQGIENSHKQFIGIALAPLVYNLSIILAAIFFAPSFGVYALAWGVVLGAFFHLIVQIPTLLHLPFKYKFSWSFNNAAIKDFIVLSVPRLFGICVTQIGLFVDTIIASLLMLGSLSIFNYALSFQSIPYGIVAVSFSVAIFSTLSEQANAGNFADLVKTIRSAVYSIFFWVVPSVVGIFLLRGELIDLVLARGAFDESAAAMTSLMVGIFIWASLGQSIIPLFARSFYSLHETKTPVLIAFFSVLVNLIFSIVLTQIYDFEVWALAISGVASSTMNASLLVIFLSRRLNVSVFDFVHLKKMFNIVLFSFLMGLLVYWLRELDSLNVLLSVLVPAGMGGLFYLFLARITKTIPVLR